jgi:hypothetical protein
VEIEVPLPAAGAAPELRELLRVAAEHDVVVPVTRRDGRHLDDGVVGVP